MADPYAEFRKPTTSTGADPYAEFQAPAATQPTQQAAPETPGFYKRITDPLAPEGSGLAVRALTAAGATLLGTPGAIYHAFADEPTEEENKKYKGDTKGLKRFGLGLERLMVDPVESAAADYASGKVTPKAALSVLPEALGAGVGSVAVGEAGGRALSKVGQLRTEMGGGPQGFARKFTGVESELKKAVTKAAEKTATAEETHAEATETAKERQGLAKRVDEGSVKLGQQIEKVEASVAKEANAKFDAVREKIGQYPAGHS